MKNYKVSTELLEYCQNAIDNNNLGNRTDKETNGKKRHQFSGLLGENVVRKLLGLQYNDATGGFDGGFDVTFKNKKADVKTRRKPYEAEISDWFDVPLSQINYKSQIFIFCSHDFYKDVVSVMGWIYKDDFTKNATLFKKGTTYTYQDDGTTFVARYDSFRIQAKNLNDWTL